MPHSSRAISIEGGDFDIVSNRLNLKTGRQHAIQSIERRLTTRLGEFFLDTTIGLDVSQTTSFSEKVITEDQKKLGLRIAILQDPNASEVGIITIINDLEERVSTYSANVTLQDGQEITITGVF